MKSPRILFVLSGAMDVGGAESQLLAVCSDLVRRGFDVQILCLWKRGSLAPEAEQHGVPVYAIPRFLGETRGPLAKLSRFVGGAFAVAVRLLKWRPDVVHFMLPHAYVVGGFVSLLFPRITRVMSRRGMNRYLQGRSFAQWQERFLHRRMHTILGNSRRIAEELLDEGVPPERLGIIYNGVDLDRFARLPSREEARRQLQLPRDTLILIKVANLWDYKGHDDLLDAVSGWNPDRPWLLLLVGRDEGARAALAERLRVLGIESHVRFVGPSDQVPLLLAAADIGVSASHEEGFSNAVVEYLAAGLAVVVTDVGGSAEAVGDAGLTVPPGDSGALREAIRTLAEEGRDSPQAIAARLRARTFAMPACVDAYEALYRGLVQGTGVPPGIVYKADGRAPRGHPIMQRNGAS